MEKAHPVDMRKALEVANEFAKIGVLFVPMPALDKEDEAHLHAESLRRLDIIEKMSR